MTSILLFFLVYFLVREVYNLDISKPLTRSINTRTDDICTCFVPVVNNTTRYGVRIVALVMPSIRLNGFSQSFVITPEFKPLLPNEFVKYLRLISYDYFNISPYISGQTLKLRNEFTSRDNEVDNKSCVKLPIKKISIHTKNEELKLVTVEPNRIVDIQIGSSRFRVKYELDFVTQVSSYFYFKEGDPTNNGTVQCYLPISRFLTKGTMVIGDYLNEVLDINVIDTTDNDDRYELNAVGILSDLIGQLNRLDTRGMNNTI